MSHNQGEVVQEVIQKWKVQSVVKRQENYVLNEIKFEVCLEFQVAIRYFQINTMNYIEANVVHAF